MDAIERLARLADRVDEAAGDYIRAGDYTINNKYPESLSKLFNWGDQPQGHSYWSDIHNQLIAKNCYKMKCPIKRRRKKLPVINKRVSNIVDVKINLEPIRAFDYPTVMFPSIGEHMGLINKQIQESMMNALRDFPHRAVSNKNLLLLEDVE